MTRGRFPIALLVDKIHRRMMDLSAIIKIFILFNSQAFHSRDRIVVMAKPTAEQYYEAFKNSYMKLKDALPINHLLPYLFKAGVVHGYLKEKLDAIPVRSNKVTCLLDEMERGLKAGIVEQFESFICCMEEFCTDNNDVVVRNLSEGIRSLMTSKPAVKQSSSQHLSEIPG